MNIEPLGIVQNTKANAFATSVGARAITIQQAVIIAAIFEFVGAVGLGSAVSDTIRGGITDNSYWEGEGDIFMLGQFCSLFSGLVHCVHVFTNILHYKFTIHTNFTFVHVYPYIHLAASWLALATKYQLPVSTTQSIVGALIGFALVSKGPDAVVWNEVFLIMSFWVLTPIFAATGAVIFFIPLRHFLYRREDSYVQAIKFWPIFVFLVAFIMTLFLMIKGLKRFHLDFDLATSAGIAVMNQSESRCGSILL